MRVDFSKNHIGYDAFGNRSRKTEYQTAGELMTTYRYNTKNQLMHETDAHGTKDYAYDHRGNLLSVTSGEEVLKAYGFDEFGNDIRTAKDIFQDSMQSFGFTGYQMDSAGGLYFAQARRYDAGAGRFVSEDFLKGHIAVPYTMNHYNYCWNRPMDLVDLNGMWPTAGVTSDLVGMYQKNKREEDVFDLSNSFPGLSEKNRDKTKNLSIFSDNWSDLEEKNENELESLLPDLKDIKNNSSQLENKTDIQIEKKTAVVVLGVSGSLGAGLNISGSVQLVVDGNGNLALQVSSGTGAEIGASGNGSVFLGGYYAPSLYSLEGFGLEEGGTAGEAIIVGGGAWQACDENGNPLYYGGYGSFGLGGEGTLASGHTSMSNTWTICEGNILDLWEKVWKSEVKGCLE